MSRTFVLGLDGAGWLLVEPWLDEGKLPNLARLMDEGVYATNRSCLPPVTFPNWKCYASGKNPGKLGVYWWEDIDLANGHIEVTGAGDFHTAELWDYLNAAGYTTGVVNMPSTYPPRPIDGVMIAGGPDAMAGEYRTLSSGYAYPSSLEARLEREYDYHVHPSPLLSSNEECGAEVDAILDCLETRLIVARDLFLEEDLDFVHVTLFYLNVLHHFFWNEEPTLRAWQLVDEHLGEMAELEETNVVVVSDHGSAPTDTEFYVNEWLARAGYLERDSGLDERLQRVGVTRERLLSLAKRGGLVELLARVVPERVQKLVPQSAGAKRERKLELIDVERTRALASGQGPVYLNADHDVEAVATELIQELRMISGDDGAMLFEDVHRASDLYDGPYVDDGPDLVLDQRPGVHVNDGLGGGVVSTEPDRWAAENTKTGIFVASGPDVAALGDVGTISILDVAPTVLASYGVPVPDDVNGEILQIFEDEQTVGTQAPLDDPRGEAAVNSEAVSSRLRDLGYME